MVTLEYKISPKFSCEEEKPRNSLGDTVMYEKRSERQLTNSWMLGSTNRPVVQRFPNILDHFRPLWNETESDVGLII